MSSAISEGKVPEMSAREMARLALVAAKKKAEEEGRPFDETEFIIQLVESKRREYEQAKLKSQQAAGDALPPVPATKIAAVSSGEEPITSKEPPIIPSVPENYEVHDDSDNEIEGNGREDDGEGAEIDETGAESSAVGEEASHEDVDTESQGRNEEEYEGPAVDEHAEDEEEEDEEEEEEEEEESEEDEDDDDEEDEEDYEEEEEEVLPSDRFAGTPTADKFSPDIGNRIRLALLTAKEKAVEANQPFDEATAIIIAQEMLARAVKMSSSGGSNPNQPNQPTASTTGGAVSAKKPVKVVSEEDQLVLAVIAARKKAEEDGKPFYEEEFTKSYLRRKKKEADDAKFAKVGAKAKLHFGGDSDAFFRDQAIVAAKEARRVAKEEGKYFDEDEFMVQFILAKRREAAMARGIVVASDRSPPPQKAEVVAQSLEERRQALLAAVKKEHPVSSSRNVVLSELAAQMEAQMTMQQTHLEQAAVAAAIESEFVESVEPSVDASASLPVKTKKTYNRPVMKFYEDVIDPKDDELLRRQLAVEATRRAVSEELRVIEQMLIGQRSPDNNSNNSVSQEEDDSSEDVGSAVAVDKSHPADLPSPNTLASHAREKRTLGEIMAEKRAKEQAEEATVRAIEKAREDERAAMLEKAKEEAAKKKLEQEAKKKQAEAAHKLALARDQARFNIMLARRKAAADGVPFDEEAYLAAEAAKSKDIAVVNLLKEGLGGDKAAVVSPEKKEEKVAEPEAVVTKPKVKGGVVKTTKRTVVPRTGVVVKSADGSSSVPGTPINADEKMPIPTKSDVEVHSTDDRKEQIERARKLALEKQREMMRSKGKGEGSGGAGGGSVPDKRANRAVALTRAEAVARAREMARSKGRTVSTIGNSSEHGNSLAGSVHGKTSDQSEVCTPLSTESMESAVPPVEPDQIDSSPPQVDSTSATEPSVGGSGELDVEDAIMADLDEEAEKIRLDEIERHREIEELKRLKAKEKGPKKSKKKPSTFWDTLFMCAPKEGDTK